MNVSAVSVKFSDNWLLATYFVKWLTRLRQEEAIARQSEHVMTLAATVQCRRVFVHWKHRILLNPLHFELCNMSCDCHLITYSGLYISSVDQC